MMTRTIAIILVCLVILVGGGWWLKAKFFESGAFLVTKSVDVDVAYRLNVKGTDLRVYEFTPQADPSKTCVFVAGTNKSDMECIDKPNDPVPILIR